jgi:hypothetical protein
MRGKAFIAGATAAAAALTATIVGGSGAGASTMLAFFGYAGGSQVRALDQTVVSDLSATSAISTFDSNTTATNSTAVVSVSGLLYTNDVATSAMSRKIDTGFQVTSRAQTGNVNLLSGAITLQAVTTTAQATLSNGVPSGTVNTQFVGIHISGVSLPINIPKNMNVTIPGVASVMLNASRVVTLGTTAAAMGAGLIVTLLKPVGQNVQGTTITLSPVYARLGDVDYENTGHTSRGSAYATQVTANVGDLVGIQSDPTVLISVTPGKTTSSTVAGANLSPVLILGTLTTVAKGTQTTALGDAETDARAAALNLFNGAITADAVQAHAHVSAPTDSPVAVSGYSNLLNLKIAGSPIPLNVPANTKINLLDFAIVTINQQFVGANQIVVRALDIKLTTDKLGLKAGTEIQIAVAGAAAS